jgi:agmatinase
MVRALFSRLYDAETSEAHFDTWSAAGYPGTIGTKGEINHGTFFWVAHREGLLSNSSVHAGIRCKLTARATFNMST